MPARNPLRPEEVPARLRDSFLWDTQRYNYSPRDKKAVIDQQCIKCGTIRTLQVPNIRRHLKIGDYTGMCHSCFMHQQDEDSPAWKGGRQITGDGYVLILCKDHPMHRAGHQVPEHRLVMEKVLGRYLQPWETVHHKNGNKQDNRPENLELWTRKYHINGIRVEDAAPHCPTCTCFQHKK